MTSSIHSTNQSENVFHTCTLKRKILRFEVYNAFSIGNVVANAKSLTNKLQQKVAIKSWLKKVVVHNFTPTFAF